MPPEVDEYGIPVKKIRPNDIDEYGIPVKKKDTTTGSLVGGAVGALNGGGLSSNEKQTLSNYLQSTKTPQEIQYAKQSPENTQQTAYNAGQDKLNEIMSGEGSNDPIATANKKVKEATNTQESLQYYMAGRVMQDKIDGADAKSILNTTHFGEEGANNLTAKTLRDKATKYDVATAPLKQINLQAGDNQQPDLSKVSSDYLSGFITPQLKDAAIKYGASKDPEFKKDLEKQGLDINDELVYNKMSSFKTGQWMDKMMNDPDVISYLKKENPNLIPAFQIASKNLRTDNPEYGINQVASEVSRAVQKTGFNNIDPVFNYYGDEHKKMADQTANQLYRDDPQSLAIWNKYIKDNQEKYMDAPSLFQGIAESGKEFGQGIVNTFTEPFTSASQDVKDKWNKEASNISADPDELSKFLRNTGHALGTVLSIGATGGVGEGLGLTSQAANMSAVGAGFFGDQLKEAKQNFDNPYAAYTSALLKTGMYMAMGQQIFPAGKIKAAFGEVSPEIDKVVESLSSGSITRDVARQELNTTLKKGIDLLGGTVSKNVKITAELRGIDMLGNVVDRVMGGKPSDDNELEKAGTTFLSNLAVAGLAKYGEMKSGNEVVQQSLDKAASTPLQTERAIDLLTSSQADKDQMKSNLDFLVKTKKSLVDDGIDPKQHSRFLFEALKEKVAGDNLQAPQNAPAGGFTRKLQEQVKGAKDVQDRILNGEDVVGDEMKAGLSPQENKVIDLIKSKTDLANEPENSMGRTLYEAAQDPTKHEQIIKELVDQSSDPTSLEMNVGKKVSDAVLELPQKSNQKTEEQLAAKPEGKGAAVIMPEENKVGENIPLNKENPEVKNLETERQNKIEEAHKPELPDIKEISDKELVKSKDRGNNIIRHDEITDRLSKLKDIINCLWQ